MARGATDAVRYGVRMHEIDSSPPSMATGVTSLASTTTLTGFAIIAPMASRAQWFAADSGTGILSTRSSGNAGWTWGRSTGVGGGSLGNLTSQVFVVQGAAVYGQSSSTIPSYCATKIAFTLSGTTLTFYDDSGLGGTLSRRDTLTVSALSTGSELVYLGMGSSGPFSGYSFQGAVGETLLWDRVLSDGEIAEVFARSWQLFAPEYDTIFFGAAGTSTTTVTVNAGSLTLTGQSVTDTVTAAVSAGTVALTGQNVALQRQTPVTAGSTSLTGQSIGITITVPISPGTLSLTGSDVTVVPPSGSFSIAVDPGALSLTGQAVTNLVTTPISEGSTSLTGQDVSVTTTVTVDPGSITLTGEVITVSYLGTQTIPIEPGTLSVTGRDVEVSITGGTKGGVGKGKNLTLKQKKKLKAVVSQEWLKAEQTAKELLQERLGNVEPAKVRVERLTTVQSLADVIAALQALSKETVTLPEQQAVIKSFEKSIDTKVIKTGERLVAVEDKVNETLGRIEKKIQNLEDLLIVVIDELL